MNPLKHTKLNQIFKRPFNQAKAVEKGPSSGLKSSVSQSPPPTPPTPHVLAQDLESPLPEQIDPYVIEMLAKSLACGLACALVGRWGIERDCYQQTCALPPPSPPPPPSSHDLDSVDIFEYQKRGSVIFFGGFAAFEP